MISDDFSCIKQFPLKESRCNCSERVFETDDKDEKLFLLCFLLSCIDPDKDKEFLEKLYEALKGE